MVTLIKCNTLVGRMEEHLRYRELYENRLELGFALAPFRKVCKLEISPSFYLKLLSISVVSTACAEVLTMNGRLFGGCLRLHVPLRVEARLSCKRFPGLLF